MATLTIEASNIGEGEVIFKEGEIEGDIIIELPLFSGHLLTRRNAEKIIYFFAHEYPPTKID